MFLKKSVYTFFAVVTSFSLHSIFLVAYSPSLLGQICVGDTYTHTAGNCGTIPTPPCQDETFYEERRAAASNPTPDPYLSTIWVYCPAAQTVTYTTVGTYTYEQEFYDEYIDPYTCADYPNYTTSSYSVTVNPRPSITTQPVNRTICAGATTTFTVNATGVSTYRWQFRTSSVGTFTNMTNASGTAPYYDSPSGVTTATLTYPTLASFGSSGSGAQVRVVLTNASGCERISNIATITVNAPPSPSVAGTNTICSGASTTLTASGGTSYNWSTGATGANLTVSPTLNTTYTVTATNVNGCTATANRTVTVNATPAATATNGGPYTPGQDIQLNASGGTSYNWTGPASFGSTAQNPLRTGATGAMAGAYTVTVTNANGCTATATTNVVVSGSATASSTGPYCTGETIALSATGGGTYSWTGPNSFSSTAQNPTRPNATSADAGTYTVVTDNAGVTATASVNVVVYANPTTAATGGGTYSIGDNVILSATGTGSFQWSGPNAFTGIGANVSRTISSSADAGTYTVTITDGNGCTATASATISVAGSASANNTSPYCPGATIQLSATGGGTYSWTGPGGFTSSAQNPSIPNATTAMGGAYTVVTNNAGVTATASTTVVVNNPPAASASNAGPYLESETINLSATGGTSYSWSGPSGFTSTAQNPTRANATLLMGGDYTVLVTDANGCTASATTNVIVGTAGGASNTGPYCSGQTIQLNATGGGTYAWSGPGFISTQASPTRANSTTAMAGDYTVTVTSTGGVTSTATTTVVVNPTPIATASNTGPYVTGATIELSAAGGTSYQWSGPNGFTNTTQNPTRINATASMAGVYVVTVTSGDCAATATTSVAIDGAAAASNAGPYCPGQTIELFASGGGSYSWSGPGGFTSIAQNPTRSNATAAMAGIYTVVVTSPGGATSTVTTDVVINAAPAATATNAGPYCSGQNIQLTGGGGVGYVWSGPNSYSNGSQSPLRINANMSMAGIYTLVVTGVNGCTATTTTNVDVNDAPVVTISPNATYCLDATINLSTSGGSTYAWSGPNGFTNTAQNPSIANATIAMSGTYTVIVSNAGGCSTTATTDVTVSSNFVPGVLPANPTLCQGQSVNLTATGPTGTTYVWSTGQGTATITVAPASSTTYNVTASDPNGCTGTNAVIVTVNANPLASITPNTAVICSGENISLTAAGGATYLWSNGLGTAAVQTLSPFSTQTYQVTVTDANGCTGVADRTVQVNPSATALINGPSTTCAGQAITLEEVGGTSGTRSWSTGDNSNSITVAPTANTTYTVTVTTPAGCTATDSRTVTVGATSPTITANPAGAVCSGESVELTVSGGTTYVWGTGETSPTITVTPTTTVTAPGTGTSVYTVSATGGGCSGEVSISVTVSGLPNPTISPPNPSSCSGAIVSLSAFCTGCQSYQWFDDTSGLITSPTLDVAPASGRNYIVTATTTAGCSDTAAVFVDVSPSLEVQIQGSGSRCEGSPASFAAQVIGGSSPYLYSWAYNGTGSTASSFTINPVLGQLPLVVVVTDVNGCQGRDTLDIDGIACGTSDIAVLPTGSGAIASEFCENTTVNLSLSNPPLGVLGYLWNTGETTAFITPTLTGDVSYSLTLTVNGDPFDTYNTGMLRVVEGNPVIASVSKYQLCSLIDSSILEVASSTAAPCPDCRVDIFRNNVLDTSYVGLPFTHAVTIAGTYQARSTCGQSAAVVIELSQPTASISASDTIICTGQTATLNAQSNCSSCLYTWSTGATSASILVSAQQTYGLTVTNSNTGCSASDNVFISVTTPVLDTVTYFVVGASETAVSLEALVRNVAPSSVSIGSIGFAGANVNSTNKTFNAQAAGVGVHTVIASNSIGSCIVTDTGYIEVVPAPQIQSLAAAYCRGSVVLGQVERDPTYAYGNTGGLISVERNIMTATYTDYDGQPVFVPVAINPNSNAQYFEFDSDLVNTGVGTVTIEVLYQTNITRFDAFGTPIDSASYISGRASVDVAITANFTAAIAPIPTEYCQENTFVRIELFPAGGVFSVRQIDGANPGNTTFFTATPTANPGTAEVFLNTFLLHQNETTNTQYELRYSYAPGGCFSEDSLGITVALPADADFATASGQSDYCVNSPVETFVPNQVGGVFYVNGQGILNPFFNPATYGAGTYDIRYTISNALGCISETRDTIRVYDLPTLSMATTGASPQLIADTLAFCEYQGNLSIAASPSAAAPQGQMRFTSRLLGSTQAVSNPFTFEPRNILGGQALTDTTILSYTYTSPQGCTNTLEKLLVVHPRPEIEMQGLAPTYCLDTNLIADIQIVELGQSQGSGFLSSSFGTNNLLAAAFEYRPLVVTPITGERISYFYQDSITGCRDTLQQFVEVINNNAIDLANPRFNPSFRLPDRTCFIGDTIEVRAIWDSLNVASTPRFSSSRGGIVQQAGDVAWIVPNQSNPQGTIDSFSLILSYNYVEANFGCAAVVRDTMEVFLLPDLRVAYGLGQQPGRDTICAQPGDSVRIFTYDYRFPTAAPLIPALVNHSGSRVNGRFFYPDSIGLNTITVSYTDQFGCSNTATDSIEVLPNPRPFVTGLNPNYCSGAGVVLFAALPAGGTWTMIIDSLNGAATPTGDVSQDYINPLVTGQSQLFLNGFGAVPAIDFGNIALSYTVVQDSANSNSCVSHLPINIRMDSLPILDIVRPLDTSCLNTAPFLLNAEVNGQLDSNRIGRYYETTQTVPVFLPTGLFRPNLNSGMRSIRYVYQEPVSGCTDSTDIEINVYNPPVIDIQTLAPAYCVDDAPINLIDASSAPITASLNYATPPNSITAVRYSTTGVPNSLQAAGFNAVFDPSTAGQGIDTIRFEVDDALGCTSIEENIVRINGLPGNVNITLPSTVLCENQLAPISAVGSPTSANSGFEVEQNGVFIQDFPGSTNLINLNPSDTNASYNAVGEYELIYRYEDPNGCVNYTTLLFEVHPKPIADFEQMSFCEDDSIFLESRGSFAAFLNASDTIQEWEWSYQGNTLPGTADSLINLGQLEAGWAQASLLLRSGAGCTDRIDSIVYVYRKPDVQLASGGGCQGDSIFFQVDSLGLIPSLNGQPLDNISSVVWDFGDGSPLFTDNSPGIVALPQGHNYQQSGSFRASVEVTNNGYCVNSDTISVIVSPRAAAFPQAYSEGFNNSGSGWHAAAADSLTQWYWGAATGQRINSGQNTLWSLNEGRPYTPEASAWLYSPCFDLSNNERPMIKFDYLANMYSFDGVALEVYDTSINSLTGQPLGWINLGAKGQGVSWYNSPSAVFGLLNFKPLSATTNLDAWTNTVSDWTTARLRLDDYNGYEKLRLRFAFGSIDVPNQDAREGFALDNVWIGERQRNVVIEHFSNAAHPSMATINDQFYSRILNPRFEDDIVLIEYHTNKTTPDSIHRQNSADHSARTLYYGAENAETVIGGNAFQGGTNTIDLDIIERGMLLDPAFRISIDNFLILNNRVEVDATIQAALDLPQDEYIVHVVVTEDSVFSEGELQRHVMRKFMPDHNALRLQRSFEAGDTLQYRQTWTVDNPSDYDYFRFRAVVLVQNNSTNEIYQVATNRNYNRFDPSVDVELIEGQEPELFNLVLFPNPARDYVNWELDKPLESRHRWQIYDLRGALIEEGRVEAGTEGYSHYTGSLAPAIYLLRLVDETKGHSIQRQFIISR